MYKSEKTDLNKIHRLTPARLIKITLERRNENSIANEKKLERLYSEHKNKSLSTETNNIKHLIQECIKAVWATLV